MSEEERQAIIHLLDKQARYEYCIKNNISFSDEDYEAYIIRQSMINKDKEIVRLNNKVEELMELYTSERHVKDYYNNIINELENYLNEQVDYMTHHSIERMVAFDCCRHKLQELKGSNKV